MDIYEEIVRLMRNGQPSALATIVQSLGSCPQKEGAKLLVREDGSFLGTLGGGSMEAQLVQSALEIIGTEEPRTIPVVFNEQHGGHVCGGRMQVFIEPMNPPLFLVIVGAGHVGKALTNAARLHGWRITIIDDRVAFANRENIPNADQWSVTPYPDSLQSLAITSKTYIVIATRSHEYDFEVATAALKTPAAYIGMIGSRRKKAVLVKKLTDAGFTKEDISRITIPVGLAIGSVTPEEIAVSIVAQIIAQRKSHENQHPGDRSGSWQVDADGQAETLASAQRQAAD